LRLHMLFKNEMEEELRVNIEGQTRLVVEMEHKLERMLWERGRWSVKKRKALSKKQQK